jgi:HNH endonuclease
MTPKKPRPFGILEFFAHGGDKARARWEKWIDRSYHPMGCWIWTGCTSTSIYSKYPPNSYRFHMNFNDTHYRPSVARIAWSLKYNIEFPYELFACHTCDNPKCVNPDHIWVGTNSQNLEDATRKGRRGISYEKRAEIADLYLRGIMRYSELIKEFNLRVAQLSNIFKAPDMVRKYGMTVVEYKRKLISEGKLPVPKRHGTPQLPK